MSKKLKVVSLNVRGLNNVKKRYTLYTWIKENEFDICLLQETYLTKTTSKAVDKEWRGRVYHSLSDSSHSRGVCILVNKKLICNVINSHCDDRGRMLMINLEIESNDYTFLNIYAPNRVDERISFFNKIHDFINLHAINKSKLCIGGDFNCVLAADERYSGITDKSMDVLKDVIDKLKLVDMWKHCNNTSKDFTYVNPTDSTRNSRIDFILCSDYIKTLCTSCNISQSPAPDHKPVCLDFKLSTNVRGKGYWKFNNDMLKDKEFEDGIKKVYDDIINDYEQCVTRGLLWDYIKFKLKGYCIQYGIAKSRVVKGKCSLLQDALDLYDRKLCDSYSESICRERVKVKRELDEIYEKKSIGYQIRSRAKWVEQGEQSTKYFLNLEKNRQNNNCINALRNDDGNTVTTDTEILQVAKNFYTDLFKSRNIMDTSVQSYFETITADNVLTEDLRQRCEGPITKDECLNAINRIKKNKSPGLDGFTIEFYIHFWPMIGGMLVDVLNDCYENGVLTDTQRCSVLSLIFKKGDTEEIRNYRPISLTNLDYRILSFVLSSRLQNVIGSIVSHDQNAYIKNRYMGYNIRLVNDIIDYCDSLHLGGVLFMTDFHKAFDSLEWTFIRESLNFFNFGPSFKKWVEILYTKPVGKIKNNGHLSEEFCITRGVRQGCPVSALLFILSIEILGLKIRHHSDLKGFNFGFPNKVIKTIQYADDCIFCANDEYELGIYLAVIEEFGRVSGLELNVSKCEGLWLGKDKDKQENCTLFGIKWPQQLRCLGIYVGHSGVMNDDRNWQDKITKITEILTSWQQRNLSLFGKVQILKSFVISQFVLPATVLTVSPKIVKQIERILYKFLWGQRDKVKRMKVIHEVKQGGLGMIDINTLFMSFKAVWITRLLQCDPLIHSWAQIPYVHYKPFLECNANLRFNFDSQVVFPELRNLNIFYKDVLLCFNRAFSVDCNNFEAKIAYQCIWGNKHITVRKNNTKNVLFFRNWIRSGVNYIYDLRFIDGVLDTEYMYRKIVNKNNIWSEILRVKKALLPYRELLKDIRDVGLGEQQQAKYQRSKDFYILLKEKLVNVIPLVTNYLLKYVNDCDDEDIIKVYLKKIQHMKETKLKEFNFKLLHGILPCNLNLYRWKIKTSDVCDVCQEVQTLEHLLYECTYVKPLWDIVGQLFSLSIDYNVILGINNHDISFIVSILSYCIYKEWLILSLENKSRRDCLNFNFYKSELSLRLEIYKYCQRYKSEELEQIEYVISAI